MRKRRDESRFPAIGKGQLGGAVRPPPPGACKFLKPCFQRSRKFFSGGPKIVAVFARQRRKDFSQGIPRGELAIGRGRWKIESDPRMELAMLGKAGLMLTK